MEMLKFHTNYSNKYSSDKPIKFPRTLALIFGFPDYCVGRPCCHHLPLYHSPKLASVRHGSVNPMIERPSWRSKISLENYPRLNQKGLALLDPSHSYLPLLVTPFFLLFVISDGANSWWSHNSRCINKVRAAHYQATQHGQPCKEMISMTSSIPHRIRLTNSEDDDVRLILECRSDVGHHIGQWWH